MPIYDVTRAVHPGMSVWPGDQPPQQQWIERMSQGQACNLSAWILGSHTGTHVDAPSHFVVGGDDVDAMPLDNLLGIADVLPVGDDAGFITAETLRQAWPPDRTLRRVLLKTRNSDRGADAPFDPEFVSLDETAARFLVAQGVSTVGTDYLSVERYVDESAVDYAYAVHHALLGAGIAVIEGLDLHLVPAGTLYLCCLPLRLQGSEASPARVILISDNDFPGTDTAPTNR